MQAVMEQLMNEDWRTTSLKALLDTLFFAGTHHVLAPYSSGVGAIFMLHHVRPREESNAFAPGRYLEITPDFLEQTILCARKLGRDIISLDEVHRRLVQRDFDRKFVCFTLDDGYLDNFDHAFPVFRKHAVPFSVYLATGLPAGTVALWWQVMEEVIADATAIDLAIDGRRFQRATATIGDKYRAFDELDRLVRSLSPSQLSSVFEQLCAAGKIEPTTRCRNGAMTWDMLRQLAASGLATIEAHTVNHVAVSKQTAEEVRAEMERCCDTIAKEIGRAPRHFAYPFGDPASAGPRDFQICRELGFLTATTTRKGVLFPQHGEHLCALPRVSLNGHYQSCRHVELFLSGVPFMLFNRFKRINVS